jgi:predicted DNA-binding transcriptional regulator AlpA
MEPNDVEFFRRLEQLPEALAVSVPKAARLIGISEAKLRQLIKADRFPAAFRIDTRTVVSVKALREWVDEQIAGQRRDG